MNISIVPLFIILYIFFKYLNRNAHKLYLKKYDAKEENIQSKMKIKNTGAIKYLFILILTGILLFFIGELLGDTIENLCKDLGIPEIIIGILLGIITSIPELITFFESQKHHNKKENEMLGVVEATNNLLTSNSLNLFIIQAIGIIIINIL